MTNPTFHFAYGSNLSVRQMAKRCPAAEKVGPFMALNLTLIFRGVADVINETDAKVVGGMWKLSPACEKELDRFEGVKFGLYKKKYINLRLPNGQFGKAMYYQMTKPGIMPPSEHYLDRIREGYRDFDLDPSFLMAALHRSYAEKKVTPYLLERYKRRGQPRWADPSQLFIGGG